MRFLASALLIVSFSAHAAWPQVGEMVIMTGFANTNAWRNLRHPIFVDEDRKQVEVEFESQVPAKVWQNMTELGSAHVTAVGTMRGRIFRIFAVEKFIEDKAERENSTAVLRFKAWQAWDKLRVAISKNQAWANTSNNAGSRSTNSMLILLTGNFVETAVSSSDNRELLESIISVGQLAETGVREDQIGAYFTALTDLLRLGEPPEITALRARISGAKACSDLVAERGFKGVVAELERQLRR